MILRGKNILLISPEPWEHIFVSKHHYAVYLARRNNNVYFLNPPSKINSVGRTKYEGVYSVQYTGFPRGLRFYPQFLIRRFIRSKFIDLERLCQTRFDIVWSFDNSVFFNFSALPDKTIAISHIVDLNQDFQTATAASTADICFCTTEVIKNRLANFNSRCYKINHGFNSLASSHAPVVLPGRSKVKVLYAGNLAMPFIDWSVLYDSVTENPDVDFVFVGPDNIDRKSRNPFKREVLKAGNVFCTGRVASEELQCYYKAADALIIAYQEPYHLDQANPHKMMEYLGSGKVVVATFTSEYERLESEGLIGMSRRNKEFPARLREVLANLQFWNDASKETLRRKYALDNSYDAQLERIQRLIGDNMLLSRV
jgi:hypothetical protein